jgi:hypothetical protein
MTKYYILVNKYGFLATRHDSKGGEWIAIAKSKNGFEKKKK